MSLLSRAENFVDSVLNKVNDYHLKREYDTNF